MQKTLKTDVKSNVRFVRLENGHFASFLNYDTRDRRMIPHWNQLSLSISATIGPPY